MGRESAQEGAVAVSNALDRPVRSSNLYPSGKVWNGTDPAVGFSVAIVLSPSGIPRSTHIPSC